MRLLLTVLAAASLALAAGTQQYRVNFGQPYVLKDTVLQPGHYKVIVTEDQAIFKKGQQEVTAPTKVETTSMKFHQTAVVSRIEGDRQHLVAIELGGTNKKLLIEE